MSFRIYCRFLVLLQRIVLWQQDLNFDRGLNLIQGSFLLFVVDEPWQVLGELPSIVQESALKKSIVINVNQWASLFELERFALCKLARPGHDHHNLDAAFSEILG